MYGKFPALTIAVLLAKFNVVLSVRKCCESDSFVRKVDSSFICEKDYDKRLQIFTNDTNYLRNNNTKNATCECLDVNNKRVNNYAVKDSKILTENKFEVNFYQKCCPLKYYYNTTTHSCIETDEILDTSFISQHFVKVGLPHCKVIVDYKLDRREDMITGPFTLHLLKYNKTYSDGNFCMDKDQNGDLVVRGCHSDLNVCNDEIKCIRKCCPDGESFINRSHCVNTYRHGLDLSFSKRINNSEDPFALIHGYQCSKIYMMREWKYQFFLDDKGIFWAYYNFTNAFRRFELADENSYCIEHVYKVTKDATIDDYIFFMCLLQTPVRQKFLITRWIKIVSCVFLLLTMGVYVFLPEIRNRFGKILISYCFSMILSFGTFIYSQFVHDLGDMHCTLLSFASLFASLSTFTWLNVMCVDIWLTFGNPKSIVTKQVKRRELKKIILYSIYAWTTPIVLCLITFACYNNDLIPHVIKPFIGKYKCYWERRPGNYGMLLYLVTPLLIIKVINLILFVKTIVYCLKVKSEIKRMNDNRMSVKQRKKNVSHSKEELILVLKLSVTMGISLTFEVVSSIFDFSANPVTEMVEVIWDSVNCCQGVFIFLIFVCKRNIYRLCHGKIFGEPSRKISLTSSNTVQTSLLRNSMKI